MEYNTELSGGAFSVRSNGGLWPGRDGDTGVLSCFAALCCVALCCAVLCCVALCCVVSCCAVLCCAVLCCAVLRCAVLCRVALCCVVLRCVVLCRVALCCAVLYCVVSCRVVLCCVVLRCVVLRLALSAALSPAITQNSAAGGASAMRFLTDSPRPSAAMPGYFFTNRILSLTLCSEKLSFLRKPDCFITSCFTKFYSMFLSLFSVFAFQSSTSISLLSFVAHS